MQWVDDSKNMYGLISTFAPRSFSTRAYHREISGQTNVFRASTDKHVENFPRLLRPCVRHVIPDRQVAVLQDESSRGGRSGRQYRCLREAFELPWRLACRGGEPEVELRYVSARHGASVGDVDRYCDARFQPRFSRGKGEIVVLEGRVREACVEACSTALVQSLITSVVNITHLLLTHSITCVCTELSARPSLAPLNDLFAATSSCIRLPAHRTI